MKFADVMKIFETLKEDDAFLIEFEGNLIKNLTADAKRANHTITKVTRRMLTRYNSYEEQPTVQQEVENGKVLTHQLPWGTWDDTYKDVINHKGKRYLRMYYPNDKQTVGKVNATETHWFIDGVEVSLEDVKNCGFVQNSYWNKKSSRNCLDIDVDNIHFIEK